MGDLSVQRGVGDELEQNSSGGKEKLGNITKRGDRYLRSLFTAGALAVIRYAKISWHQTTSALAHSAVGQATDKGGCHCTRQQDRAHGMGNDRQRRALQGTCRLGGMNEIAPVIGVM